MTRPALSLGKKPATHDPRDVHVSLFRAGMPLALPPTHNVELFQTVPEWGMLGNDRFGCCAWAGPAHETMFWNLEVRDPMWWAPFTTECVLSDYETQTGFIPSDPATDRGTNMRDGLKYRRSVGIVDAWGARHTIEGFAAVTPGSPRALREAIWNFGAVPLGLIMPSSVMDQYSRGEPWTWIGDNSNEGGHYVPVMAWNEKGVWGVSWGGPVLITWDFVGNCADECFAALSTERLDHPGTIGRSREGIDLSALRSRLAAL